MRNASKKASGSTKNPKGHAKPKHRGWRVQDGHTVSAGTILATQLTTRFHPGLNVMIFSIITLNSTNEYLIYVYLGWIWEKWHTLCFGTW